MVVGEPVRAFSGNQFGLTFPVFVHYGIELWVPEVGGRVDPGSDAHDLVMSLYGGMSKGERNRIKIRVRSAMAAQAALDGWFLGGRPPYGYRLVEGRTASEPRQGGAGSEAAQARARSGNGTDRGADLRRVFAGVGLSTIGERLTREGVLCPSAYDPTRNSHRSGVAWSKSAIRAILNNPRYTGHQVWNRQRKDEVLIDVEDVAQGHETVMRWNRESDWIWSPEIAQTPLICEETYEQTRQMMATKEPQQRAHRPRATQRTYLLRSLIFCGLCNRRMRQLEQWTRSLSVQSLHSNGD